MIGLTTALFASVGTKNLICRKKLDLRKSVNLMCSFSFLHQFAETTITGCAVYLVVTAEKESTSL